MKKKLAKPRSQAIGSGMSRLILILLATALTFLAYAPVVSAVPLVGAVDFNTDTQNRNDNYATVDATAPDYLRITISWKGVDSSGITYNGTPPDERNGMHPDCDDHPDFNWCALDRDVATHAFFGTKIEQAILNTTPDRYVAEQSCLNANPNACRPGNLSAWQEFVRRAIDRYGPNGYYWDEQGVTDPAYDVRVFEVWNEPNLPSFWDADKDDSLQSDADQYAALVGATDTARDAVAPTASLMAPSFARRGQGQGDSGPWLVRFNNVANHADYDYVSTHPYGVQQSDVLNDIAFVRSTLPTKPMYISEHGWGSSYPNGSLGIDNLTRTQQADRLTNLMNKIDAQHPYVRSYTWFNGIDNAAADKSSEAFGNFGLWNYEGENNYTKKPVFDAFRAEVLSP